MAMAAQEEAAGTAFLFRVLDTALVTPSADPHPLPPRSLPLTSFDVKWLPGPPVQRLFFYRLSADDHLPAILAALKASLSAALRLFYPLAGHLRLTPQTRNRYELFYSPGDAVAFTAAEYHAGIDDLASYDHPIKVASIVPLLPHLPKGRALLAVQATVLLRARPLGLALGLTLHHSACDGASFTHFLHTWAAACAGAEAPPPPVIDRTLIADPKGLYDIYWESMHLPSTGDGEVELVTSISYPDGQLLATFTLPQELLRSIKDAVADAKAPRPCSSLVATYSFIWSCYCRAKAFEHGSGGERQTTAYLLFAVDHRARLNPAVPERYLGNCLGPPAIAGAPVKELAAGGRDGLLTAFRAVTAAIEEAVAVGDDERWKRCVERVKEVAAAGILSTAGSPRFRVYDMDFGWGRPVKADIASTAKSGAISMAEARAGIGMGIEVGISMPAAGMERFRKCFTEGMASLLHEPTP